MGSRRASALGRWLPFIVGGFATVFCVAPGFVSPDPTVQYGQALDGLYTDWHPPVMAWVWRLINPIWPGAGSMLVFHQALFWSGLGLWVNRWVHGRKLEMRLRWWVAFLFAAYPPVLGMLGIIWKDVGFGAAMLLASGLLLFERHRPCVFRGLGWIALLYAFSIRLNSLPALLPIGLAMAVNAKGSGHFRINGLKWLPIAMVLGVVVGGTLFTKILVQNRKTYPEQQILLYDLAAISVATHHDFFPKYLSLLQPNWSMEWIRWAHHPLDAGGMANRGLLVQDEDQVQELKSAWKAALIHYPHEYLLHRHRLFIHLMSLHRGAEETFTMLHPGGDPFPAHETLRIQKNILKYAWTPYLEAFRTRKVFSNGLYFLSIPLLLWIAWIIHRSSGPMWAVGASGYVYTLAYFFVGTAGNFRYSWWTVLAAMVVLGEVVFGGKTRKTER